MIISRKSLTAFTVHPESFRVHFFSYQNRVCPLHRANQQGIE